jgi:hypothetical protein
LNRGLTDGPASAIILPLGSTSMPLLHEQVVRSRIESRLRALTPGRQPLWGKMSVDQMLWHLNEALAGALGEIEVAPPVRKPPIPG